MSDPRFDPVNIGFSALSKYFQFFFDSRSDPVQTVFVMKLTLLAAIAESIANRSVPVVCTSDPEGVVAWIMTNYWDVDFDPFPDRITIFGDDPSIPVSDDGDGDEGHFVLHLVFPPIQSNPYAD